MLNTGRVALKARSFMGAQLNGLCVAYRSFGSETKSSGFGSGCQLYAEVSSDDYDDDELFLWYG